MAEQWLSWQKTSGSVMIGRKPDLLCIGAQKAATTWFHRVMGARDDMWVPPFKEVHFFDHKFCPDNRKWAKNGLAKGLLKAETRHRKNQEVVDEAYLSYLHELGQPPVFNGTWYKKIFSRAPMRMQCLDATPEYCTLPEEGVDFVAKFLRDARFIYIIRDPVERAISQLRMNLYRRDFTPKNDRAWLRVAQEPAIENRGDYKAYIPRWKARFDERRLLFLPYGQVANDPHGLMRKVEAFANLEKEDPWGLDKVVHKSKPLEVPDIVRDDFEKRFKEQRAFLNDTFDAEFTAQI